MKYRVLIHDRAGLAGALESHAPTPEHAEACVRRQVTSLVTNHGADLDLDTLRLTVESADQTPSLTGDLILVALVAATFIAALIVL